MVDPSPAIRLVVSDVDGTLVRKDKTLSPETIAAVHRLREAGIAFTVISARPPSGVMPLLAPLAIDVPAGAFNGGTLFRPDGSVLIEHLIDPAVVRGVFDMARDLDIGRWVFADGRWFASDADGPHVDSERVSSDQSPVVRDDFSDLYDRAGKLTFVSDDAALLKGLADRAGEAFGEMATIAQSQTYYLDVTAIAANKGDGVAELARVLGIDLSQVAVMGDMDNDIPMFRRAALSFAMGQAGDAVKAAATHVSSSNQEDGVAHAIDRFLLKSTTTLSAGAL